jgi:hypothetical protein
MVSRASAATRNLALAVIAFTICFTSWGLVAPLAKHLQDSKGWSDTQVLLLAAVPVLCGATSAWASARHSAQTPSAAATTAWPRRRSGSSAVSSSSTPIRTRWWGP